MLFKKDFEEQLQDKQITQAIAIAKVLKIPS